MSDYDDLVRRLRQNEERRPRRLDEGSHVGRGEQALAADAIERLQAELAAANADAEAGWNWCGRLLSDDHPWAMGDVSRYERALAAHRARVGGDQ